MALRILRGAAQSEASLRRRLETRGFSRGAAQAAVAAVARLGYVDDDAYAGAVAARRSARGWGRRAVAAELRARGVGERPLGDALRSLGADEERAAALQLGATLLARDGRRHAEGDARRWARVAAGLQRRGFEADVIRHALAELAAGEAARPV